MARIFGANMFRLRKSRLFWWSVILTALVTAGSVLLSSLSIRGEISEYALESYALAGAPIAAIVCAAAVIMFLGTDHSEKTVRNKVIVGNKRGGIYAANVLTGIIIGCSVNGAWLVGGLAGVPILGWWKMPPGEAAAYIAASMACSAAVSAAAALVGMMIQRRSGAVAVGLVSAFALLWCASGVYRGLCNNEREPVGDIVNGELMIELRDNPNYVGGAKRTAYELALHSNPLGVSIALSNCDLENPAASLAGAAFVTIFISSLGAAAFQRKDLN